MTVWVRCPACELPLNLEHEDEAEHVHSGACERHVQRVLRTAREHLMAQWGQLCHAALQTPLAHWREEVAARSRLFWEVAMDAAPSRLHFEECARHHADVSRVVVQRFDGLEWARVEVRVVQLRARHKQTPLVRCWPGATPTWVALWAEPGAP